MFEFKHPFCGIISGPSSCGKTVFLLNIIKHRNKMFDVKFKDIIWCFGESGAVPSEIARDKSIKVFEGIPSYQDIAENNDFSLPRLVVLDDLQREENKTKNVVDFFTRGSHHRNISVFLIMQNLFSQGPNKRDLSLNASYIISFKQPRDRMQIKYLARQVWPEDPKFVTEAYGDATSEAHGYLVFDLKQQTPDAQRLCTNILPGDVSTYCYVPRYKYM
jgi:hypothetical protein